MKAHHSSFTGGDYWDLDAALAEDERVSVRFNTEAVRLGYLDSSSVTEDLQKDARVELPLWLGKKLKSSQGMVNIILPRYLQKHSRVHMEAHARSVDLRAASPYYYEVSQALAELAPDKEKPLIETLLKIYSERFLTIMDYAQNSRDEDVSDYVQKLTVLETDLYNEASERSKDVTRWKKREIERIESLTNKRRRQ